MSIFSGSSVAEVSGSAFCDCFSRQLERIGWVGVCLALALTVTAQAQAPGAATPLVVVPAEKREVSQTLPVIGSVQPLTRSLIASEVAGLVEEFPVDEGDRLEKGAVICKLRDTTRRFAYEEAQSTLKQWQAQLAELEAGTRKEELARARAAMEEARTIHERWKRELERVQRLWNEQSASLKEYNDTIADEAAARLRLAQATADYDLAVAGPRKEEITRARMQVEAGRSMVARLKDDLERTVIRAPFTGYITRQYTDVGSWVTVGGTVVEMIDLERVKVRVDVPESAVSAARVGAEIGVTFDAVAGMFSGTIRHVIPQADERARTFPIEIEIPNDQRTLKSGMFARARVPAGPTRESVVVPRDAILQRGSTHMVVVVGPSPSGQGQVGMPVPVQLGASLGDWVAIDSSSVQPGMPVAVKGHDRIYGPQPAAPIPAGDPATQPATTQPVAALNN
ncbi:MAG: hypothetical protein AMXMBFR13_42700 [Phycisphaerae bacterium]